MRYQGNYQMSVFVVLFPDNYQRSVFVVLFPGNYQRSIFVVLLMVRRKDTTWINCMRYPGNYILGICRSF